MHLRDFDGFYGYQFFETQLFAQATLEFLKATERILHSDYETFANVSVSIGTNIKSAASKGI